MTEIFYSLQDFMLHSKNWTYIGMGLGVIALWLFYLFLTGRDDDINKF